MFVRKLSMMSAMGIAIAIGGSAHADTAEVENVDELIDALKNAKVGEIILKTGVYDFDEWEKLQQENGKAGSVDGGSWGVNCTNDDNGVSCLLLKKAISLQGADTAPWAEKIPETVIKGSGRLLYLCGTYGVRTCVSNITFEEGNAPEGRAGGGVLAASDEGLANRGLISNCVFRACSSSLRAGAACGVKAVDCLFEGNQAAQGGAAFNGWFENCTFRGNVATNSYGSAVRDSVVVGCTFENNGSMSTVYNCSATNCTFLINSTNAVAGCESRNSSVYGCRFGVRDADATVTNAATSVVYGGTIANCVFDSILLSNKCSVVRDAEYVRNTLFRGCLAKNLVLNDAALTNAVREAIATDIVNCTFVGNTLNGGAGGLVFAENAGAACHVCNTICADNRIDSQSKTLNGMSADLAVRTYTNGVASVSHSLCKTLPPDGMVAKRDDGRSVLADDDVLKNTDPLFVSPSDYSKIFESPSDYPKMPYLISKRSRARNTGDNQEWMASAKDLAGIARIAEDTVDMGCFEWGYTKCGLMIVIR